MLTVYKIPVLIDSVFESKASLPFVEVAACSTSFHVFRIPGVISKHSLTPPWTVRAVYLTSFHRM